jgi:hypothetical protein
MEPIDPAPLEEHEDEGLDPADFSELAYTPPMADLASMNDLSAADLDPVTKDATFRSATLLLLDGEITVDEWLDEVAEVINEKVDLPWIPEVIEEKIFNYALGFAAKMLHGFLRDGTVNAPTNG